MYSTAYAVTTLVQDCLRYAVGYIRVSRNTVHVVVAVETASAWHHVYVS